MHTTSRLRPLLGGLALASVLAVAAPAAAQAAPIPSPATSPTWTLKTSWVNYLTNPLLSLGQGRVTPTGPSAPVGIGAQAPNAPRPHYAYRWSVASDATAGVRTVTLAGGIDFEQPLHGIDIAITNVRVLQSTTARSVRVTASYKQTTGTVVTKPDVELGTVNENDGRITLSADGAAIFNGGANGSYAAGQEFGSLTF
jgi:hypothetical protein